MKKTFLSIFTLLFAVMGLNYANAQNNKFANKKALIVYYSYSGNTKAVAEQIQKETRADIFELQLENHKYPSNYKEFTQQAKEEIANGFKPALKGKINNINQYDVIYIGSPCWWATYAPAVSTFLADYDLSGKTIVPFMTHEGSGLGRMVSDLKKDAPKSTVLDGLAIRGGRANDSQNEVKAFINKINN